MSTLNLVTQLDTAVFPSHSIVDISSTVISVDIDLGVDVDNGTAVVRLSAMPGAADFNIRLYVYASTGGASTVLIFNGYISEMAFNPDRTATLTCVDMMARLRNGWSRDDRTYTSQTDSAIVQNLVEASGIDPSLTSIAGLPWTLGVVTPVVLHGGTPDPLTGNQGPCDVPLDLIRRIDEATPLFVTYSAGNGAVYRRAWAVGVSVASFSDGSGGNAWDIESRKTLAETYNACKVIGATTVGIPVTSLNQTVSSDIPDPPKYRTRTVNNPLIEDQTQADNVTAAYVNYESQFFRLYVLTTTIRNDLSPADTITVTDNAIDVTARDMLVRHLHHHIDAQTATTTIQAKY